MFNSHTDLTNSASLVDIQYAVTNVAPEVWSKTTNRLPLLRKEQKQKAQETLSNLLSTPLTVEKDEHGKPFIQNPHHISITHCQEKVGVVASTLPVGIDLHHYSPKTQRVAKKYLNDFELEYCQSFQEKMLFDVFWAAKEAVFKIFGVNLAFKDIQLHFDSSQGKIEVDLAKRPEKVNLAYQTSEDLVLCLAQLVV